MKRYRISIAVIVIIILVIMTSLLLGGVGIISYKSYSRQQRTELRNNHAILAEQLSFSLASPLWNFDHAQIVKILESIMKDNNVYGIVVRQTKKGEILHARVRDADWNIMVANREFSLNGLLVAERNITFLNESIGIVKLFTSQKFLEHRMRRAFLAIISIILLVDLILIMSLYLLLWRIIIKPLKEVEQYAVAVSTGSSEDIQIQVKPFHGELETLRSSIEKMISLLKSRCAELQEEAKRYSESEERFRALVEHAPEAIVVYDVDQERFTDVNEKAEQLFRQSRDELLKLGPEQLYSERQPDGRPVKESVPEHTRQALAGEKPVFERTVSDAEGNEIHCEVRLVRMPSSDRNLIRASFVDISEQLRSKEALEESEERFRTLVEYAPEAIVVMDVDTGLFTDANENAERLFGLDRELFCRLSPADVSPPIQPNGRSSIEMASELIQDALEGRAQNFEWTHRNANGDDISTEVRLVRLPARGRNLLRGSITDITDRKNAEKALQKEYELNRTLINASPALFVAIDAEGKTLMMNDAMLKKLGYTSDEITGADYLTFFIPENERVVLSDIFNKMITKKETASVENHVIGRDGSRFFVEWHGRPVFRDNGDFEYFFGFGIDITERKILQNQLIQAQKMESMGTLAGGIAHDFNNILNAIIGFTYLARLKTHEGSEAVTSLDRVTNATKRATDLVKQILTFSRMGVEELQPVLIAPIVKEALKLLRASIPATIEFRTNITDTRHILADSVQIQQILMNLCTNAYHAMQETGGVMEVDIQEIDVDPDFAAEYVDMKTGAHVRLRVSDTGKGIDPSNISRIFEPYFTTKEKGRGTGLGLSVVHGIVKNCGGTITVASELNKGTTFQIYLPVIQKEVQLEKKADKALVSGSGNVLFVDDEESMVLMGREILESLGYKVTGLTDSRAAMEQFKENPGKFDVVYTDMTMPGMTGMNLAREVLRIRSDIPVILSTGYSEGISDELVKKEGIRELVMKPVSPEKLSQSIRRVLHKDS